MGMTQLEREAVIARQRMQEATQDQADRRAVDQAFLARTNRKQLPGAQRIKGAIGDYFTDSTVQGYAQRQRALGMSRSLQSDQALREALEEMQSVGAGLPPAPSVTAGQKPVHRRKRAPGRTVREINAQQGLSRDFTSKELGIRAPRSLPQEQFFRHQGRRGGVFNAQGDSAYGTKEDGSTWNPGNDTLRMLNRTPDQRDADEQARLDRVAQNQEMQANAQNIATGLDRSTQESQLYRANRLAREKPTAANIARHRTLSADMERARQTRMEQQGDINAASALGAQNQFSNRVELAKLDQEQQKINAKGGNEGLSKTRERNEKRAYAGGLKFMDSARAAAGSRAEARDEGTRAQGEQDWNNQFAASWGNSHTQLDGESVQTLTKITDTQRDIATTFEEAGNWWLPRLFGMGRTDPYDPKTAAQTISDVRVLQRVLNGEFEGEKAEVALNISSNPTATATEILDGFEEIGDEDKRAKIIKQIRGINGMELLGSKFADYITRSSEFQQGLKR